MRLFADANVLGCGGNLCGETAILAVCKGGVDEKGAAMPSAKNFFGLLEKLQSADITVHQNRCAVVRNRNAKCMKLSLIHI